MSSFFVRKALEQLFCTYIVRLKEIGAKAACKMLVKLTPGVNFTNVLQAAFTSADPKSTKKTVKLSSFIALLGFAHVKAAHRMLVKLTPD